jgi:predicted ATPase
MLLQWFEVQGYKNFRAPVRLEDLGALNVIHGDNNTGRSNLLESIGLLFVALGALREQTPTRTSAPDSYARPSSSSPRHPANTAVRSESYLVERGFEADEIFDFTSQGPIHLRASFQPGARDVAEGDPPEPSGPIQVDVRIERRPEGVAITLVGLVQSEGVDSSTGPSEEVGRVLHLLGRAGATKSMGLRFLLIRSDRSVICDPRRQESARLLAREPMPQDLALALYEAEREKGAPRRRFDRFIAALEHMRGLVGDGRWRMDYALKTQRAELSLERGSELIPLRLMGAGVQQIAVLAGRLAMAGSAVVAMEEPEANLRWSTQHRLRDVLRELCGSEDEPIQLIVASHSSAFEFEPMYYALSLGADGPQVRQRPAA